MEGRANLIETGWLRVLPPAATRVYVAIQLIALESGRLPEGDLDDPSSFWVTVVATDGLDAPYNPASDVETPQELERCLNHWQEWQGYAAGRGRSMSSYRDVIEFLMELGIIERLEGAGEVRWRVSEELPYAEDVLPLTAERIQELLELRWRESFREAARAIVGWLGEKRVAGATHGEVITSIRSLAEELKLDPEDARHGLTVVVTGEGDITASCDPERAEETDAFVIKIDWKLFEIGRTPYRIASFEDAPPQE